MKRMKKIMSLLLAVFLLLPVLPCDAFSAVSDDPGETCHTMTEAWFRDNPSLQLTLPGVPRKSQNAVSALLDAYFDSREQSFAAHERIPKKGSALSDGIAALEARAGLVITDAEITTVFDNDHVITHDDGSLTVFVYEWVFFDYDDLSDAVEGRDVSGFGINHKIRLRPERGGFVIASDEYDASDSLGICTINESTEKELEQMHWTPAETGGESPAEWAALTGAPRRKSLFCDQYDPDACAAYADQYVYHNAQGGTVYENYYNSAYANYNSVGGDCANYTSQCISAGGMPQVQGTHTGTDGWYYNRPGDRSGTWTYVPYLRDWMAKNRGLLKDASDHTVYKGSPVFYMDQHATICVGYNSAGVPIINSHNRDWYHTKWNYWEPETVTTVQLTPTPNPGPPSFSILSTDRLSYAAGETVNFSLRGDGTSNILWIYSPDGDTHRYPDLDFSYQLAFETPGHYQALAQTRNRFGTVTSEYVDFLVGPPLYAAVQTDKASYEAGETVTFSIDADGDTTTLQVYGPDGDIFLYPASGPALRLNFGATGHFQAFLQTKNGSGSLTSDFIDFVIGPPTYASVSSGKKTYQVGEPAVFVCASDGSSNTLRIEFPDGTSRDYPDVEANAALSFSAPGEYQARLEAQNEAGVLAGSAIRFTVECPHTYRSETTEPDGTQQGYTTHICTICGDIYRDDYTDDEAPCIDISGHDYAYALTEMPTTERPGTLTGTCGRCGDTRYVSLPVLCETDYACEIVREATCAEAGVGTYTWNTTDYGVIRFDASTGAAPHSYTEKVKPPTCGEYGCTVHTCAVCGDSCRDTFLPATGHTWDTGTVARAQTETENGIMTCRCTRCGETRLEIIPPEEHRHRYAGMVVPASCTEGGYTLHLCVCGESFSTDQTEALGHNYADGVCTRCGVKESEQYIRFDDVQNDKAFYFMPVFWAYEASPQITNGLTRTEFGPDNPCTRGQVMTILWRAAGCPEPKRTSTPFTDLKKGAFYEKAVAWAAENGITNGMTKTAFAPDATCTRAQIVTFLWRFRGSPAPKDKKTAFTDVSAKAFYANAVAWAMENKITNGMTKTAFAPDVTCTRGQVVTFLYRAMQ